MRRVIEEQRLSYVASVCPDGSANLSPKGTLAVWDDDHVIFAHLHSPATVTNIESGNDVIEINVVDPIIRKGYRFKGPAEVHRRGTVFEAARRFFRERSGLEPGRVKAAVIVRVADSAAVVSPAYDDGSTEEEVEERSLRMYGLRRTTRPTI